MESQINYDGLLKSHKSDGTVKSFRCKARESLGMRRTYQYAAVTKDEAQRSPSALLRAVSMSNGRWTFYEAVKVRFTANERFVALLRSTTYRDTSNTSVTVAHGLCPNRMTAAPQHYIISRSELFFQFF